MSSASISHHPIQKIQRYCMEQQVYYGVIQQEYDKLTKKEEVTRIAQIAINNLCDFTKNNNRQCI